jgi:hypothetical protein
MDGKEWPLLTGLWRAFRTVAAVLMMAFLGGWVGGITLFILTIFVYGIGAWIGGLAGIIIGGFLAFKMPAADVAFVFAVSCLIWIGGAQLISDATSSFADFVPPIIGAFVAALLTLTARKLPRLLKVWVGGIGSLTVALLVAPAILERAFR